MMRLKKLLFKGNSISKQKFCSKGFNFKDRTFNDAYFKCQDESIWEQIDFLALNRSSHRTT